MGTVKYKNGPVEGANVQFVPTQGISAIGVTDANGKFTLMTAGKPGAAAGDYKVTVSKVDSAGASAAATPDDMKKMQAGGNMERKSALPEVYGSVHSTTLTATVKSGDNDIPLDLK